MYPVIPLSSLPPQSPFTFLGYAGTLVSKPSSEDSELGTMDVRKCAVGLSQSGLPHSIYYFLVLYIYLKISWFYFSSLLNSTPLGICTGFSLSVRSVGH